jgi:hypothetical protein
MNLAEQNRKSSRGRQPITGHPLFPVTVALWFGALFGLGSLAIGATLLESVVAALRIDAVVPAAAPPLGVTARILLALALAALGGVAGAVLARRIARPRPQQRQRRRTATGERAMPVSPYQSPAPLAEVAEDGEPAPRAAGRRRSLAIEAEHRPYDVPELAPLPGGPPQILKMADVDVDALLPSPPQPVVPAPRSVAAEEERMLDLAMFTPPGEYDDAVDAGEDALAAPHEPASAAGLAEAPAVVPEPDPVPADPACEVHAEAAETAPAPPPLPRPVGRAADRLVAADLDALSSLQLIERLAISLQRRRTQLAAAPAAEAPAPVAGQMPAAATLPSYTPPSYTPSSYTVPSYTVAESVPLITEQRAFAAPAQPEAAPARPATALPAAFRPIVFDEHEDEDEDHLADFAPPRSFARPAEPIPALVVPAEVAPAAPADVVPSAAAASGNEAPADDVADEEDAVAEERYGSLLGHARPAHARLPFLRLEDVGDVEDGEAADAFAPAVVFPGHGEPRSFAAPMPSAAGPSSGEPAAAPPPAPEPLARRFAAPAELGLPATPSPKPAGHARRFDVPLAQPAQADGTPPPASDPAETERALRAALASLQRMSGAA